MASFLGEGAVTPGIEGKSAGGVLERGEFLEREREKERKRERERVCVVCVVVRSRQTYDRIIDLSLVFSHRFFSFRMLCFPLFH